MKKLICAVVLSIAALGGTALAASAAPRHDWRHPGFDRHHHRPVCKVVKTKTFKHGRPVWVTRRVCR
jgi:hypothetical protein